VSQGTLAVTGTGKLGTSNVTVAAGATLQLGSGVEADPNINYIDDLSSLVLNGSTSTVFLNFIGTETIASLTINGTLLGAGSYNSGSGYSNITGGGSLLVVPEPSAGVLLIGGLGMMIMVRRSRSRSAA
jgi:hypothetical protein